MFIENTGGDYISRHVFDEKAILFTAIIFTVTIQ